MNCPACQSDRTYQFEVAPGIPLHGRPRANELPVVCRSCGAITVGGTPLDLPDSFSQEAMSIADAADAEAKAVVRRLEGAVEDDEEVKIEDYFRSVYVRAYLDGFVRALMFFRHEEKTGRVLRLRSLWSKFLNGSMGRLPGDVLLRVEPEAYNEFGQLLNLRSGSRRLHAQGNENDGTTIPEGAAPLQE